MLFSMNQTVKQTLREKDMPRSIYQNHEMVYSKYFYSVEKGIVTNENTKLEEDLLWWPGYPANITDYSNVLFHPEKRYFKNEGQDPLYLSK